MKGSGALSSFGGDTAVGPPLPIVTYSGRISPGDQSPSITEHRFSVSAPIHRSEKDSLGLSMSAGQTHWGNPLLLDSVFAVPEDLYKVEIGAQYYRRLENKRNWGLRGTFGFAGDKFSEAESFSLGGSYGFPDDPGKGYWMMFVYLSNNSPLGNFVPIPGFSYIYRGEKFSGMFGLPLISMQWEPVDPWMFSFSAFGPSVNTEIARGHLHKLQIFIGYNWSQQMFLPSRRSVEDDRLYILEQKAFLGLRTTSIEKFLLEIQGGYSFDRSVHLGDGLFDDDRGRIDLDEDFFISISTKFAY